jgi:SecD/SecF fusion protein
MFAALIAIFLYLLMRYEFAFAVGAIVALFHDVLMVPGLCVLFGQELSIIHVGALLTIAGYSINDTVVIFDRIREYLSGRKNAPIEGTINDALNSTLGRSINTSMTVLLTLLVMFIFGSDDIRGFCFAMIIGVISGVYSTLFIASPSVVDMRKWAGRKAEA